MANEDNFYLDFESFAAVPAVGIVTGSHHGYVRVFDLKGKKRLEIKPGGVVCSVAPVPGGGFLTGHGNGDHHARLFDAEGKMKLEIEHPDTVKYVFPVPFVECFLTQCSDGYARLYNREGVKKLEIKADDKAPDWRIVPVPGGGFLMTCSNIVRVYDFNGVQKREIESPLAGPLGPVFPVPGGGIVAGTTSVPGCVYVFDAEGKQQLKIEHPCGLSSVFPMPGGGFLTCSEFQEGFVRLFDAKGKKKIEIKGKKIDQLAGLPFPQLPLTSIFPMPGGEFLTGGDQHVCLYNAKGKRKMEILVTQPDDNDHVISAAPLLKRGGRSYQERQVATIERLTKNWEWDPEDAYLSRLLISWRGFDWKKLEDPMEAYDKDDPNYGMTLIERIQKFDKLSQEQLAKEEQKVRRELRDDYKMRDYSGASKMRRLYCELTEILLAQGNMSEAKAVNKQMMQKLDAWGSPASPMDTNMARTCIKNAAFLIECEDYCEAAKWAHKVKSCHRFCRLETNESRSGVDLGLDAIKLYDLCVREDPNAAIAENDSGCCTVL